MERLGMTIKKKFIKQYNRKDIPHLLYSRSKEKLRLMINTSETATKSGNRKAGVL